MLSADFLLGLAGVLFELIVWLKPFYASDREDVETWFSAYHQSTTKRDEADGDFY